MAEFSRKDFISDLPRSIIEMVLTKLPIRDAVRTSILSKQWRYQWATMTRLVFDDKCVPFSLDRQVIEKKIGNFVSRFLFLHDSPIHKFKLSTSFLIGSAADLDQWLLFLSRKDIQELDLGDYAFWAGHRFRTPSCIFSCKKLTKLKLSHFEVNPPLGFQGFPCLKYLSLRVCTITLEVLENLILYCPMLEKLELVDVFDHALTICAPNLKDLTVGGSFKDIYLEHTPLLVDIAIFFSEDGADGFTHHRIVDMDLWERGCPTDFTFKHLKSVEMTWVMNKNSLDFLKFVLGRSPVLEVMSVSLCADPVEKINMGNEVLHFRRASSKVDIRFFD